MFPENCNLLPRLSNEERPGPVTAHQLVVRLPFVSFLPVFLNDLPQLSVLSLDVAEPRAHLVCGEAYHGVHAQAAGYVVVLCQLSGRQLVGATATRHGGGGGGGGWWW